MRLLLHVTPPRQGLAWIRQGWQVFRRAPLPLSALLASYLVAWLVLGLLGWLGGLLLLGSLPLLSLVYMLAAHHLLQKRRIGFGLWAEPFKLSPARTHAQLRLALLYVVATVALMFTAHHIDGGQLETLQIALARSGEGAEQARAAEAAFNRAMGDDRFLWALLLRVGGATLLSVPFWHAPALVHWGGHSALKALFSSVVGMWTNRGAFALNGLAWVGLLLLGSLLLSLLAMLLQAPGLVTVFIMPLLLFSITVFYCGLYFTFIDCFRFEAEPAPSPPTDTPTAEPPTA